ncbi:MAG: SDR family NAD(P)-dependent oxidoreductase [Polyangiales bacterium]|nr:SDR family NAD(P)-dependent oxidoreductase [Myxococcales bacterium]MCB9660387.1 SDR family NAD(P)-dependent oxidoreductase [Sandaracinaceae bacterium]
MRAKGAWVITGGASGFGLEFARRLMERGETVALWDQSEDALASTRRALQVAHTEVTDVRDPVSLTRAAQRTRDAVGPIAHVINSAGVLRVGDAEQVLPADYRLMMEVNYLGSVHVTQALLPHLEEAATRDGKGSATLLLVASVAGLRGFPQLAGYCASKFAVVGFGEALRVELRDRPIDVRILCPPPGDTPMVRDLERVPPVYKLSRLFSAEEVVAATLRALDTRDPMIFVDATSRATRAVNANATGLLDRVLHLAGKL